MVELEDCVPKEGLKILRADPTRSTSSTAADARKK
jgi:hypothetical protein